MVVWVTQVVDLTVRFTSSSAPFEIPLSILSLNIHPKRIAIHHV
jgi:hypothetical protein